MGRILVFGIIGIAIGMVIPTLSNQIKLYKQRKPITRDAIGSADIRTSLFLAIANGTLWIYVCTQVSSIATAALVSLILTITILIALVDIHIRLIPNELVLLLACLGIVFQILHFGLGTIGHSVICMVAVGGVFVLAGRLVGFNQVGAGDIKLASTLGLILGYPTIKIALIGMSTLLLVFCMGGLVTKKLTMQSTFPFAPFMMLGTIGAFIYLINT